jgi:hypothetical protein
MAAAGGMLSNVAGVVAPAALSARAGVPAATALMESLVGGSPTMTAVGDTARDVGRKIVERANQRGPVPVMGSNFANVMGDGGVTIANKGDNVFEVKVGGKPAGELSLSEGNGLFFMDDAMLAPEFRGKGVGSAAYDLVEKRLGERLVPSPRGLSDAAVSFWRKRLAGMDPTERATTLEYYGDALRGMGLPQKLIQQNLARIRPVTPEIEAADRVAEMLRTGREDEITEELFAQADPQRLTQHYASGNTGMDMPMDYASRMARAAQMRFDTSLPLYHGTTTGDIKRFRLSPRTNDFAIYSAKDPVYANQFAGYYPDRPVSDLRLEEGSSVIPLFSKGEHGDFTMSGGVLDRKDVPNIAEMFGIDPQELLASWDEVATDSLGPNADVLPTYSFVEHSPLFKERLEELGMSGVDFLDYSSSTPYDEFETWNRATLNPADLRSKFARFDPRLSHLGNLSAGVAAGAVGLEAAQYDPDQVDTIADTVRKREFATGGAVKYDPAAVDNIINQIREVNRG